MKSVKFCKIEWDIKLITGSIITLILAIISGIVLCILTNCKVYIQNYAIKYVYNVYNLKNAALLFSTLVKQAAYCYACFCVARFARYKFFSYPIIFLKCTVDVIYAVVFFTGGITGAIFAALIVFIPSSIFSFAVLVFILQYGKEYNVKNSLIIPAFAAAVDTAVLMLLVNVVFRIIIAIV